MRSLGSRRIIAEPIADSANCATLHVAREVVGVSTNKHFQILLRNVLNKPVQMPKRMTVTHITECVELLIELTLL